MGVSAVSQLQYDATMTAQSHVSVENSEHGHSGSPDPLDKCTVFDFHHIKYDGSTGTYTWTLTIHTGACLHVAMSYICVAII